MRFIVQLYLMVNSTFTTLKIDVFCGDISIVVIKATQVHKLQLYEFKLQASQASYATNIP